MKKHSILYHNYGANQGTNMTPVKVWEGSPDYTEEDTRCFSFDDNGLVKVKVSEVREIELPEWLDPEEWIRFWMQFHFVWVSHKKAKDLPENLALGLLDLYRSEGFDRMKECSKLLCSNLRSSFRKSLRDQLVRWIEDPEPNFPSPFSPKQWNSLIWDGKS